jgi:transposase
VVRHTEAQIGFALLARRWMVERNFGWAARFRRLARDYEPPSETLAGQEQIEHAVSGNHVLHYSRLFWKDVATRFFR